MRSFIAPILFILASIGLFVGYVQPGYQGYKDLTAQAAILDDTLNQSKTLDQVWQGLVAKNNAITADDADRLSKMLPSSIDTIRLITEMNSIAAAHGIVIQRLDISGMSSADSSGGRVIGPDQSQYGTLSFGFGVAAPYQTFLSFLADLERNLQLMDVTGLTLSAGGASTGAAGSAATVPYTYSITAQTYWLK